MRHHLTPITPLVVKAKNMKGIRNSPNNPPVLTPITPRALLLPGWNRNLRFDLTARTWKTEQSRWKHTSQLDRTDPVREIGILLYPWDVESGSVYLDNLGFDEM